MSTIYKFSVGIAVLFGVCICLLESSKVINEEKDVNIGHASYEQDELQNSKSDTNQTTQIGSLKFLSMGLGGMAFAVAVPTIYHLLCLPFAGWRCTSILLYFKIVLPSALKLNKILYVLFQLCIHFEDNSGTTKILSNLMYI